MAKSPNFLVVMSDGHGHWASGCYDNSELQTPAIDHLASTGTRFTGAFTPSPVCSPARASFWTGRLPSQHGVHDWLDWIVSWQDWLHDEVTLARILKDNGYVTGLDGTWHVGGGDRPGDGFDDWFRPPQPPPSRPYSKVYGQGSPPNIDRHAYTDHAIDFLRRRDTSKPFFLYVGYTATHSPWSGHAEYLVEPYRRATFIDIPDDEPYPFGRPVLEGALVSPDNRREALAQYYAAVAEVDRGVGRLLDELDFQQLSNDTIVIYTSDHGHMCGHHGLWGKGNATLPLNMLEESIRVPLLVRWPTAGGRGQVRTEFVDHCDIFQTILDCAGIQLTADAKTARNYPGRSFAPALRGEAMADWREFVFGEYGDLRMIRTARHKLIRRYPDGPHQLFDLHDDPRETRDVFTQPAHEGVAFELTARIEEHFRIYENPAKSGLRVRQLPQHNAVEAWRPWTAWTTPPGHSSSDE